MTMKRCAILMMAAIGKSGCDYFPGPSISNAIGEGFETRITYSNGKTS